MTNVSSHDPKLKPLKFVSRKWYDSNQTLTKKSYKKKESIAILWLIITTLSFLKVINLIEFYLPFLLTSTNSSSAKLFVLVPL
jgi:hypothetical protein